MTRDIKRRDTSAYQLATCGNKQIALWSLDPYQGEMVGEKVVAEGRGSQVRQYTTLAFSEDRETLYAGTTSGDFVVARGKMKMFPHVVGLVNWSLSSGLFFGFVLGPMSPLL